MPASVRSLVRAGDAEARIRRRSVTRPSLSAAGKPTLLSVFPPCDLSGKNRRGSPLYRLPDRTISGGSFLPPESTPRPGRKGPGTGKGRCTVGGCIGPPVCPVMSGLGHGQAAGTGSSPSSARRRVSRPTEPMFSACVESLEVEAGAPRRRRSSRICLPEPLAHLVGRGLARPAEVAGELEVQLALADRNVPARGTRSPSPESRCRDPQRSGTSSSRWTPMSNTTRAARMRCMSSMPMWSPGSFR